jgi:hypothetical protein
MSFAAYPPRLLPGRGYGLVPAAGPALPAQEPGQAPAWVAPVVIVGFLGILGAAVYLRYKLLSEITAKHGVGSALAFEAGSAGIGMLTSAFTARRNPSRKTRRGRRRVRR